MSDELARDIARIFRKHGYDIRTQALFNAKYLGSLNFSPGIVFDVGVRQGTPDLYKSFPDSYFVLVDPQKGGEGLLKVKPNRYEFKNVALGETRQVLQLNEQGGRSSFLTRTPLTAGTIRDTYQVDVIPFDDLVDEVSAQPPIGIKIDVEGFELEVAKGLNRHAKDTEFIIVEVSVLRRFVNGPLFSDLVVHLREKGFEFLNFLNPTKPNARLYDCLFVRKENPLLDGMPGRIEV